MGARSQTAFDRTRDSLKAEGPFVSIVVVNYNDKEFLKPCLDSILRMNYQNFEVVLVDNHSTDGSVEFASKHYGNRIVTAEIQKNIGYGPAINIGVEYCRGKYLVFLNPDLEVDPDFLKEAVRELELDASIGLAQCKIMCLNDRKRIQSLGEVLDPYCSGPMSIWGGEIDNGLYDEKYEITYPMGAATIARRSLIEKIGLFDPDWFADDGDIGWRAWLAGSRVVTLPKSIVYHKGQATFKRVGPRKHFFAARARPYMIIKNAECGNLIRLLPQCLLLGLRDIIALLTRSDIGAKYMILGLLSVLRHFDLIWKRRLEAQTLRMTPDDEIFKHFMKTNIALCLARRRSHWKLLVWGQNDYHLVLRTS